MPNPFYNALNQRAQPDMTQQFQAFVQQMQGQDPNALIRQMVASGRVSQAQLNQVQQQAQQMMGMIQGVQGMFAPRK